MILLVFSTWINISAQDLSGLSVCIDPGHGNGNNNQGPTGLREADINLKVALFLKAFLKSVNIDTVLLTRLDDSTNPRLSQRESFANSFGVDWFHSVHHNAFNGTRRYTLLLYEELGNGQPQWPGESDVMSSIIAQSIWQALRTSHFRVFGDFSFYGQPSYLGVLNSLLMPGELSEGTFHDNLIEENKLRNPDFIELEAQALFIAFLQYYEEGTLTTGTLSGIITNAESRRTINNAEVSLKPLGSNYSTDLNNNGLYVFHNVAPGQYQVTVNAQGFDSQEKNILVKAQTFNFLDISLPVSRFPMITMTLPVDQATDFGVYNEIGMRFSRQMDRPSVESAFSANPQVAGHFIWNSNDDIALFEPDIRFEFSTEYEVRIAGTALDKVGFQLDGNSDGTGGDDFTFTFTTTFLDTTKPVILDFFPVQRDTGVFLKDVFFAQFNEEMDPASLNNNTILLTGGGTNVDLLTDYIQDNSHRVTFTPSEILMPGTRYFITFTSGISLVNGAQSGSSFKWQFITQNTPIQIKILDDFEGDFLWSAPDDSPFTQQTNPDSTLFQLSQDVFISNNNAGKLKYEFLGNDGFIQIDKLNQFNINLEELHEFGYHIYGDNSDNQIRLFFTDQDGEEALPWTNIDWSGWKLFRYNLNQVQLEPGLNGNGIFDSQEITLGGIQLKFIGHNRGTLYFDDFIEIVPDASTSVKLKKPESLLPENVILGQNYPNPFNPKTVISYRVPDNFIQPQKVTLQVFNLQGQKVRTLVDADKSSGYYSTAWDGNNDFGEDVSTGLYIYQVRIGHLTANKKMIFIK